jgi:hypothetical protein
VSEKRLSAAAALLFEGMGAASLCRADGGFRPER